MWMPRLKDVCPEAITLGYRVVSKNPTVSIESYTYKNFVSWWQSTYNWSYLEPMHFCIFAVQMQPMEHAAAAICRRRRGLWMKGWGIATALLMWNTEVCKREYFQRTWSLCPSRFLTKESFYLDGAGTKHHGWNGSWQHLFEWNKMAKHSYVKQRFGKWTVQLLTANSWGKFNSIKKKVKA